MKKTITALLLASLTAGVFALPNLLKKEDFGANAIDNISANLSWENLKIKETYDTSSIEVETYCNNKKHSPEISVSGSTLYIETTNNGFSFFSSPTGLSCTVIIYVPQKKDFDEITLKTTSGEIEIERALSAKDEIKITSTSGEINSSKGLFADTVKITTTSGDIELYNIDADDFIAESNSADIEVIKFTGGTGKIHTTSGDINADDFASEYANFQSTSGGITVKKFDCDYFDAKNTSGGIEMEFLSAPAASSAIHCTSGDIDIYLPMRAKFSVNASSNSGTFRDKFTNNRVDPRSNYKQDYNGGGAEIQIQTTSGDITLEY